MSVKHKHQTTQPENPNADVSANEWNADHDLSTGVSYAVNGELSAFVATGYSVTSPNTAPAFSITGTINSASPAVDAFVMSIANPNNNAGNIFRLKAGAAGATDQFKVDTTGDMACSGSGQVLALSAPPAGGNGAFGLFLGNFSGGNTGLYFGTGTPTLSTFGRFGSLYMDQASPGIPYYNSNGTTGWNRLLTEVGARLIPVTAPSAPASGFTLYVDTADSKLKAISSGGTVTTLALP